MSVKAAMRNVEINIGKACNLRCIFCLSGNRRRATWGWVPLEKVKGEVAHFRSQGYKSLGILGGEPAAYPHLLELLEFVRENSFERVALCTNGVRFRDGDFLKRVVMAGVTRFSVSIHSHLEEVEDRLCGFKGSFRKKEEALRNMVAMKERGFLRDNLSLNILLSSGNIANLHDTISFFLSLGIRDMRINLIRPEGRARGKVSLSPAIPEIRRALKRLILLNEFRLNASLSFGDFPLCLFPPEIFVRRGFAGRYIGEMRDLETSCSVFSDLHSGEGADRFGWHERKVDSLKERLPPCRDCEMMGLCEGIWKGYLELYHSPPLTPLRGEPFSGFARGETPPPS